MPPHARRYCSAMVTDPVSLNSLSFSLVGPGKVGTSLAHWLVGLGARLQLVSSRDGVSAESLTEALGGRVVPIQELSSEREDLLVLSVSDPDLAEIAERLSNRIQARVVLHTSGRATAEILAPLRELGSHVGSLHPLKAFPEALTDRHQATGTVFGIDGDPAAKQLASTLVEAMKGLAVEVPPAVRSRYHLAATVAAGGVLTLLSCAAELAESAGLSRDIARGYLQLARGAVDHADTRGPFASAITGPVARGDLTGLLAQIDEIRDLDPQLADLLERLARRSRYYLGKLRSSDP